MNVFYKVSLNMGLGNQGVFKIYLHISSAIGLDSIVYDAVVCVDVEKKTFQV